MTDGYSEADAAKRAAMGQVEDNANEIWLEYMLDRLWEIALTRRSFTADDIYDRYQDMDGDKPTTHEPRAMGPVFLRAAKLGYCEKAFVPAVPSRRRSLHASPRTVWTSLIYEPGAQI